MTPAEGGSTLPVVATLPVPASGLAAASDGRSVFIFGGYGPGFLDTILQFDPTANRVRTLGAHLPTARHAMSAVWDGHEFLLFGGRQAPSDFLDEILRYDPVADTIDVASARLPGGRFATSAVWAGNAAYIFGGSLNGRLYDQVLRYDPIEDRVDLMAATLPTPRQGTTAVWDGAEALVVGGYDARFGGNDPASYSSEVLAYDPAADQLTQVGHLPHPTQSGASSWMDGGGYLFGGALINTHFAEIVTFGPSPSLVGVLEQALPSARGELAVASVGNTAYVLGGLTSGGYTDEILAFRPDTIAPSLTLAVEACTQPGAGDWCRVAARTVRTTATDDASGIASEVCTIDGVGVPCGEVVVGQGSHTVVLTASDGAGNNASKNVTVMNDNVAPSLSGSGAPPANENGWNREDVTVSYTCTDATSDIAALTEPQDVRAEGPRQLRAGTCVDGAGNEATLTIEVNVDKTKPAVAFTTPEVGHVYAKVRGQTIDVGLAANDRTVVVGGVDVLAAALDLVSGVQKVQFAVDGILQAEQEEGPYVFSWNPAAGEAPGPHNLTLLALDLAGNQARTMVPVDLAAGDPAPAPLPGPQCHVATSIGPGGLTFGQVCS